MTTITERIHSDIDALYERVEALFPIAEQRKGDTGFGRGFREILALAYAEASDFNWETPRSMIAVVDELVAYMERNEDES